MSSTLLAVYRFVIRLMPADYRRRDGETGAALLARLLREADRGGPWRAFGVGTPAILDAIRRLPIEHIRSGPSFRTEGVGRDLRYAVRALAGRPLGSAAAIATIAIGIGLNAAVFSIVDWILIRPLPYAAPDALVRVFSGPPAGAAGGTDVTYSEFATLSTTAALQSSAAFSTVTRVLASRGVEPVHVLVARVSGDLLGTLGAYPAVGRPFDPRELASGSPVVIVSDALWRSRFAGDAVVGRAVTIDGQPHTIVGVTRAGLGCPRDADVWRPITAGEREDDDRENVMIGRLSPGISRERATHELEALGRAITVPARRVWIEGMHQTEVRDVRLALIALLASSALILVMASANVAALVGARSAERGGEMALRGALGASPGRLVRQLLIEHLVLATAGGFAGLLAGRWALAYLVSLAPQGLPRAGEIALDARVVACGIAATLAVGLFIGVRPALRAARADLQSCLAISNTTRTTRRTAGRLLVTLQTALAVVLTVSAVLLARSLQHLVRIDDGFAASRLLAVDLNQRGAVTGDERELYRNLVDAAESLPGVQSAAVALQLPLRTVGPRVSVSVRGSRASQPPPKVTFRAVSSRYFSTTGIPLVEGRMFTERDTRAAPVVGIVNAAFVRDVMGGQSPLGATLIGEMTDRSLTVVGVVRDVTPAGERDRPALYLLSEQVRVAGGFLIVRTEGRPDGLVTALADRVGRVAPALARDRVYPLSDLLARGRAVTRFSTQLASGFAILALALAAIGIYSLTAAEVGSRWRELGIRLALGGAPRSAVWTVTRPAAASLFWGSAVGLAASVASARWMRALLHGVGATDLPTLTGVPVLLVAVSVVAAGLAAIRVLRADPASALRQN
jgi:putative ABC transport system permease protein